MSTYALENSIVLLLLVISVMPMLQCGNVTVIATVSVHCFFHSYCHYQLILLFLLLHQLLLIQLFTLIASLIATYTGADVTIAI